MSLYLVTGQSGTGKSTLLKEFKARGVESFGTDENGIARHRFIATGDFLRNSDYQDPEAIDWLNDVDYMIDPDRIKDLHHRADSEEVFVFGGADDIEQYFGYFAVVFALVVDTETLRHRLATRTGNNNWGKKPHELKHILQQHQTAEEDFRQAGAIIVDAQKPIQDIAEFILGYIDY